MSDEEMEGLNRRDFLRKAAMTTAAAAWVAPVIQTVAATPAFAADQGTPAEDECNHSTGLNGGCMGACGSVCGGDQCGGQTNPSGTQQAGPCTVHCPPGTGNDNPCQNAGLCEPANFVCSSEQHGLATYVGPL